MIALLTVLASLLVPSHGRTQPSSKGSRCLGNTRQLMLANLMYQSDNRELLPMSFHGGYVPTLGDVNRPWATGWLDWSTGSDNTNLAYLVEKRYASLAEYFGASPNIYKCPADAFVGPIQKARGWTARARSVSANLYVGKGNAWAGGPGYSAGGPNNLTVYRGATKGTDLFIPGPSRTWVYADEHPDSMNDPGLWPPVSSTVFPDVPATYHNNAAGFAFADGHSELHRWRGPTMNKPRSQGGLLGINFVARNMYVTTKGDPDLLWLSYGSPRNGTRTAAD